ncbi:hypothetical protein WJX74_008715 [Apatococcus lobatus]|uniref:BSD domain-containing protein n=1 Tax=Apatococcus lobatus TaxID=904363 RepID=A0AAW1RHP3_9CHLO
MISFTAGNSKAAAVSPESIVWSIGPFALPNLQLAQSLARQPCQRGSAARSQGCFREKRARRCLPVGHPSAGRSMGFWNVNLEAAQAQASQAGPWAKRWLQTVTEQTMHLAEQASSKLPPALHTPYDADTPPSQSELSEYGITAEFMEFVRSLTYSTFRDFQHGDTGSATASASSQSEASISIPEPKGLGDAKTLNTERLTPWQEKHALLVVRSVQEINELRFVLVPKRMTDQEFWHIYFTLARKYLPAHAFDPTHSAASSTQRSAEQGSSSQGAAGLANFDLQDRFQQLSTSAKHWGAQASASLQAATASGQRQGIIPQALWQKLSPAQHTHASAQMAAADLADLSHRSASSPHSPGDALPVSTSSLAPDNELAADPDLEAYLRDVGDEAGKASARGKTAAAQGDGHPQAALDEDDEDGDIDEDFDKYISELNDAGDEDDGAPDTPSTSTAKHDDAVSSSKSSK